MANGMTVVRREPP